MQKAYKAYIELHLRGIVNIDDNNNNLILDSDIDIFDSEAIGYKLVKICSDGTEKDLGVMDGELLSVELVDE